MFKILDWNELEEVAVDLLKEDSPVRPKNSGGSKKEEDVVGSSLMVQCKHTTNKNITIKDADLKRLIKAADALQKLPVFLSANHDSVLFSVLLDNCPDIPQSLINIAIVIKSISILKSELTYVRSVKHLHSIRKELTNKQILFKKEIDKIKKGLTRLETACNTKYDDLTMVDLFNEER